MFVRKIPGQSDLRKNYFVLCRITYALLNDYQSKKTIAINDMILILFFFKIYSDFNLSE